MKKKALSLVAFALVIFGISSSVSAATQIVDNTYLYISAGSNVEGAKRTYDYNNQYIEFHWTEIITTTVTPPYLNVTLHKKSGLFYSTYNTTKVPAESLTQYARVTYNNSGSGKYYFSFNTGNATNPTGAFKANPVYIRSFS